MRKGFASIFAVFALLFIVSVIGAIYFTGNNSKTFKSVKNINNKNESLDYTIPVLKDYDPSTFGRNLWLYSRNGERSKQVTSDHGIETVYGYSPDKKRILLKTIKLLPTEKKVESYLGLFNLQSNQISKLFKDSYDDPLYYNDVYWLDNDKIIYSKLRKLQIYTISTGSTDTLVDTNKSITDNTDIIFKLSPNRQWLVYNYQGQGIGDPPQQDHNNYLLDLSTKTQNLLPEGTAIKTLDDNYIIYQKRYQKGNQIWKMKPDGSQNQLVTTIAEEIIKIKSINNKKKFVYQIRILNGESEGAELHLYNMQTNEDSTLFKVSYHDGISDLQVSESGDIMLFYAALNRSEPLKGSLILYNLETNVSTVLINNVK